MFVKKHKRENRDKTSLALWLTAAAALLVASSLAALNYLQATTMAAASDSKEVGQDRREHAVDEFNASKRALTDKHGFVVWSSNRSGQHDIYKMSLPDMHVTALTTHPHTEYFPRISPDGRKLIFSRSQEPYVSQRNWVDWDLYLLNLETGEETRIANNATFGSWLNNDEIAYAKDGHSVVRYDIKSEKRQTVFETGVGNDMPKGALISTPSYNPENEELVFTGKQSHIGLNTGHWGTALVKDEQVEGVHNGCQLFWSSTGELLFQVVSRGNQGNSFVYVDPKTYEVTPMLDLRGEFSHEYFPKTSNDGSHLVFAASRGKDKHEHDRADYEIFLWKIGGNPGQATRITFHSGNDNWPDVYLR